jgi:hypothetical protein
MIKNPYITTSDFKAFQRVTSTDAADDLVIDAIVENTSRFIDDYTGRHFYPTIETRLYDIPNSNFPDRDTIFLDEDLLSLTTLTNGDLSVITNTDYIVNPVNSTPYYSVKLRNTSNISWQSNAAGSSEQCISVNGVWGFHNKYAYAWTLGGTLGAAISTTSTLSATMTAGHTLANQQIWKIDNEILQGTVLTNALTFNVRGDNGSMAATHLNGASVYIWSPISQITLAAQQIVNSFYKKRFGENVSTAATITAAGVVLAPRDIPDSAIRILMPFVRQS